MRKEISRYRKQQRQELHRRMRQQRQQGFDDDKKDEVDICDEDAKEGCGEEKDEEEKEEGKEEFEIHGGGCLVWCLQKVFQIIDRPWKMYPLGFLFGLGFDTSSEVALLGIASIQGAKGTSIWLILVFPILFTGKCTLPFLFSLPLSLTLLLSALQRNMGYTKKYFFHYPLFPLYPSTTTNHRGPIHLTNSFF